jgi:hypothetical protein
MKKLFLISTLFISSFSFSQSIRVENGKAVSVIPATEEIKTILSKDDLMNKKDRLNAEINILENEITRKQKQLSDLKGKLLECETACEKLGYK